MEIYLVVKVGVYNHDVFGAFERKANAIERAIMLSKTENDNYHSFDVISLHLDQTKDIKVKEHYGQTCDEETIFSIRKLILDSQDQDEDDGYDWNLNLLEM